MSDVEKKSTPTKKSKKGVSHKRATSPFVNAKIYILLALFFALSSAAFYWLWENQKEVSQQQQLSAQNMQQQLSLLKQQQQELRNQSNNKIQSLENFQETLRENLTKIVKNNQYFRNDWLVSEAEYLIQLANYRLLLEKDVTTAIVALKAADSRLAAVADPALLKIREILKNDLQALNNVQITDLAGISITITALSNNVANLPLLTPDPKTHKLTQTEESNASSEVENLSQLPAAIWKDIKSLIVVRNHQQRIKPLLAPEQHFFLLQNLALLFEQTRLAVLSRNNDIYQERLQAIIKWIKQYFDPDHNITRNMLASIESLQKLDINPSLPDISSTFSAVRKYRTQGNLPKTQAVKAKEK